MWAYHSIFYQIYPIGFCGAPVHNDGQTVSRIRKLLDWTDYLADLGVDSILLNPVFESTITDMIQGISVKSTVVLGLMRTLPGSAALSMRKESV